MANDIYNIDTDPTLQYQQYSQPPPTNTTINQFGDVQTTTIITTVQGNSGKATGPTLTISGGATGLVFDAQANSLVLNGTLAPAHGGTGQSSYTKGDLLAASAATTLGKLAVGADNARLAADASTLTGLIWILASTGWGAAAGTLSRAAYTSYAGQTVSNPPTQVEVQQIDDALKLLSQVVAAILTDLRTQRIFNN